MLEQPVAGVSYPRNINEFDTFFESEESCRTYLERLRWPNGFQCPRCSSMAGYWPLRNGTMQCRSCKYMATVTAGTLFEDTRKPLRTWFLAIWYVMSQKHGANALGLQRVLGLGSYQTAWTWLHKLRRAMVRASRDRLKGEVEIDETFLGGVEVGGSKVGNKGRGTQKKAIVVVAVERVGTAIGRIRLQRVASTTTVALHGFVREMIEPGTVVHTDGWQAYLGLDEYGYEHRPISLRGTLGSRRLVDASQIFPRVSRVTSLLKRWWLGTLQGGVQPQHIDYYLDEFTFRFNRRTSKSRGLLFFRMLQQAVATGHVEYRRIVGGNPDVRAPHAKYVPKPRKKRARKIQPESSG